MEEVDAESAEAASVSWATTSMASTEVYCMDDENTTQCSSCGDVDLTAPLLCVICSVKVRKPKQAFGSCCEALVRQARRDAQAQGVEEYGAFKRLEKLGSAAFVQGIMEFKARCFNHRGHRRPQFAWCRYLMIVELSSRIDVGQKSVWLYEAGFVKYHVEMEGLSTLEAKQKWTREKQATPPEKISKDGLQMLWCIEHFVLSYDSKATREEIQLGAKVWKSFCHNNMLFFSSI